MCLSHTWVRHLQADHRGWNTYNSVRYGAILLKKRLYDRGVDIFNMAVVTLLIHAFFPVDVDVVRQETLRLCPGTHLDLTAGNINACHILLSSTFL